MRKAIDARRFGQRLNIRSRGFTLIELLVVVAIIALLMALMIPVMGSAKARARTTVCAANLKSLGLGVSCYLDNFDDHFFPYYMTQVTPLPVGRLWWFGFEANGPGAGKNRPLDKTLSPLAAYTANLATLIQCPDFPFSDAQFYPKFVAHGATYGYNWHLANWTQGGTLAAGKTKRRADYPDRQATVLLFADGIQFGPEGGFNEGFYINCDTNPGASGALDGYAHFRHQKMAQYVMLDGHVEAQYPQAATFSTLGGAISTNLVGLPQLNSIYGY
jgi:prepilin-type N-terminal cleavage/methylation domain-containing protein/prepilin-type processing-associated H-X9-DG protein